MMRLIAYSCAVLALCSAAHAATVIIPWTNWNIGQLFTNDLRLYPVTTNAEFWGQWLVAGPEKTLSSSNGYYTNVFPVGGNFAIKIKPNAAWQDPPKEPIVFAVPSDTNVYFIGQILVSGYNTYNYTPGVLQLTSSNGSVGIYSPSSNGRGIIDLAVAGFGGLAYSSNFPAPLGQSGSYLVTNGLIIGLSNNVVDTNGINGQLIQNGTNQTNFAQQVGLSLTNYASNLVTALPGMYSNSFTLTNATPGNASNLVLLSPPANSTTIYMVTVAAHCDQNNYLCAGYHLTTTVNQQSPGALTVLESQVNQQTNVAWSVRLATSGGNVAIRFENDTSSNTTINTSTTIQQVNAQ